MIKSVSSATAERGVFVVENQNVHAIKKAIECSDSSRLVYVMRRKESHLNHGKSSVALEKLRNVALSRSQEKATENVKKIGRCVFTSCLE